MIAADNIDYRLHLPPYRSLLNPSARYDYKTHKLVPFNPNELNLLDPTMRASPSTSRTSLKNPSSSFKMKYRSLLSDVSRSLSLRISNPSLIGNQSNVKFQSPVHSTVTFKSMPVEILDFIFSLIDDVDDYRRCLYTSKLFYQLAKPYFYQDLSFTSTYRFAQFITYLRLNVSVGQYVKSIDLSNIRPGNYEETLNEEDERETDSKIDFNSVLKLLAGWRDWKYKTNPLYSLHPHPSSSNLTKVASNSQSSVHSGKSNSSSKSLKFAKLFKFMKSKKRRNSQCMRENLQKVPKVEVVDLSESKASHPKINKFLLNYSSSRDIPIGYVLHLINLCPNIVSLDLGNLSISTDYRIKRSMICKYQTFDIMNNYPKEMINKIDNIMTHNREDSGFQMLHLRQNDLHQPTSSASSVYSITTFSKPIKKYNSLLPPLPQTVSDISYLKKGDGEVFLSDLNLKSINNNYLIRLNEHESLSALIKMHGNKSPYPHTLKYINLSSVIWLNKKLVQVFLRNFTSSNFGEFFKSLDDHHSDVRSLSSLKTDINHQDFFRDLVVNLTDSGMYKNLQWAQLIDFRTFEGCKLANEIINDQLIDDYEQYIRRERMRRGRIAENYLN
ncbi:uncharacterized protein PRCAT00005276001 [Priceomyces carsonii]|uniref:uncharacterized protein n=1 Tax=Priceomyces carsonii TaxID=28549 RepID=UPI002ED892CA|nr:unnamed protein product [Priceomyces carsonii]